MYRLNRHTKLMLNNTHTHPFNGPFSGTTRVSRYQKGKPIWILLEQETVSGSGISWAVYKSTPRSRQITTPAPHHSVFLQAGCPSCHPTNSVKALKAQLTLKLKYIHRGHCDARQKRRNSVQLSRVGGLDPYLFASYFLVSLFLICGPSAFRCSMHLFVNMCSDLIACTRTYIRHTVHDTLIVAIYLRFLNTVISQIKYDTVNCLIQQLTINSCQQSGQLTKK